MSRLGQSRLAESRLRQRGFRLGGSYFTPASLFTSGGRGVWYYPPDLTTLFQDDAGTTPVTAAGQTVGLMLDKSKGAGFNGSSFTGLGDELVTNGGFDSDTTGWSGARGNETLSVNSGSLRATADASGAFGASFEITGLTVGASYIFKGDDTGTTASFSSKRVSPSAALDSGLEASTSDISDGVRFTASASTMYVGAIGSADAGGEYLQLDNISVRELPGYHATKDTAAARPEYLATPDRIDLDGVDDNMSIDFGSEFIGTVLQGTPNGVIHYDIDVSDGEWSLTQDPAYVPDGGEITGMVAVEGTMSAPDVTATKYYLQKNGAGDDFAGVTSMFSWFRDRDDITAIYVGDWDTSSVTSFNLFAFGCSSLTTLDVSNWDTSSVTSFANFAFNCSNLTALDVSNWDTSSVTSFANFARNCSSLTTLDVSNWDTSSVTDFRVFATNCSSLTTLDVSNWDISSVTNIESFVRGCSSLTALDVSNWDTSSVTDFGFFATNCSSLTTLDVSNWDTSSVTKFFRFATNCSSLTTVTVNGGTGNPFADSPCTDYEDAFSNTDLTQQSIDDILVAIELAGTSDGTFDQSGGSAPSATGEAAVTALRSRGWTVTVTGGF